MRGVSGAGPKVPRAAGDEASGARQSVLRRRKRAVVAVRFNRPRDSRGGVASRRHWLAGSRRRFGPDITDSSGEILSQEAE